MEEPRDITSEQAILKLIITSPELYHTVSERVIPGMFGDHNSHVYRALGKMISDGISPDEPMLKSYLGNNLAVVGDDIFKEITSVDVLPSNLDSYIKQLRDKHVLRLAISGGIAVADMAIKGRNVTEVTAKFAEYADKLTKIVAQQDEVLSAEGLVDEYGDRVRERFNSNTFRGYRTGLENYDQVLGGIAPTEVVIIAARPSMGKTSLMLTWLLNTAKQNITSCLFSYEMSLEQILKRLLAIEANVSYTRIDTGVLSEEEIARLTKAFSSLKKLPLYVTYSPAMHIDSVIAIAAQLARRKDLKVAGLDYVQLLLSGQNMNTNAELSYISRQLKLSAGRDNLCWLVGSQLSRKVEMRDNKRPILSDLRDSGSLEQDADVVLMLYRHFMYEPRPEYADIAELLIRKNRNGPVLDLPCKFTKETMKFSFER